MLTYCISHKPLMFKNNQNIHHILLGDELLGKKELFSPCDFIYHISEIASDLDYLHNVLGGCAGTFAIARILNASPEKWDEHEIISINQYRKFVHHESIGSPSLNYPGMMMISSAEALELDVCEIQKSVTTPFLISQPLRVGNTYKQYCQSHKGQDLLRYTAIAIDLQIIEQGEAFDFFTTDILLPGGIEFGFFPASIFVDIVGKLEQICLNFAQTCSPTDTGRYNRRALAFCNERMGSYLLLKTLHKICGASIPAEWFGYMHTASDNPTYFGSA